VDRIRSGDPSAMEELYAVFSKGVRFFLCRHLGMQELDDKVHDTFLIVVQAIRRDELRDPERLMGFVRTVVRRQVAAHIHNSVHARRDCLDAECGAQLADLRQNPEQRVFSEQKLRLMRQVLNQIDGKDKEILIRFYLKEQSQERICSDMKLTDTQFRLLKSRAKARFGEAGRKRLARAPLTFFLRGFGAPQH
jgi:RNA polymerase sigma factor (sigma-70 family)